MGSHTGLKIFFLRPFVPWAVRNFSSYWRNKMIDWLPFPAAREVREMSYVMEKYSREILVEKRTALQQGTTDSAKNGRRDLMTIMRTYFLLVKGPPVPLTSSWVVEANSSTSEKERLSDIELTGQIKYVLPLNTLISCMLICRS